MSASALRAAGVEFTPVTNPGELADGDALLIGREAFDAKPSWALPPETLAKLRGIVVFEQSSNVLNNRFGFRVTEWGAREGFVRTPEHPVMAGFPQELLANWRGDATLTPVPLPQTPSTVRFRGRSGTASTCRGCGGAGTATPWLRC